MFRRPGLGRLEMEERGSSKRPVGESTRPNVRARTGMVHAVTRTVFRSAVADKLIPTTPFEEIPLPKVLRSEVRPPDAGEVQRLVEAAPERLRALVVLAALSGLRSGELLGLSVDRVDSCAASSR